MDSTGFLQRYHRYLRVLIDKSTSVGITDIPQLAYVVGVITYKSDY